MNVIQLKLNNQFVDLESAASLNLRLTILAISQSNLSSRGGSYTNTITLPRSKRNCRFFSNKGVLGTINNFYMYSDYLGEILLNGAPIIRGKFRLEEINNDEFVGEFTGFESDWMELMDNRPLNETGYDVDGNPTWLYPFEGATTINAANQGNINTTDLIFPCVVYNNTPQTDYYGFSSADVFGTYDGSCNQIASPKDFPGAFPLINSYFGKRDGLTFEDFPPAVYYATLIKKVFADINWTVTGDIFNQAWFNAIIMLHTGEFYKYNYKTLAYIYTGLIEHLESAASVPFFPEYENYTAVNVSPLQPEFNVVFMHYPNIGYWDDITTRIDKIASFNKYLVTDENVGHLKGGGYIAPTSGRYKIRVKSFYFRELIPDNPTDAGYIDGFGNGVANYGWDDNVLLITRRNQTGDLVFSYDASQPTQDFRSEVALWMNQTANTFTTKPSDIVAYCSPKRVSALGANDINATGSPLTNWTESVNVISSSHTIINNTTLIKSCESSAEIEITLDLQQNERINFYWTGLLNTLGPSINSVSSSSTQLNNLVSEIEVEYLCGLEDLDVAGNLPSISQKDFISSFINQFSLQFNVNEASKNIEFIYNKAFYTKNEQAYDITSRIDINSVVMTAPPTPKNLAIGYNNDEGDRLLNENADGCTFETVSRATDYANVIFSDNPNIYGLTNMNVKNMFSATRFTEGQFDLMDISDSIFIGSLTNTCTSETITSYWWFTATSSLSWAVPSVQSYNSYTQNTLNDLEYDYKYTPRIVYYLGTGAQYYGIDSNYRIKLDSRGPVVGTEDFTIEPTVCAFDTENNNPYRTLRYDTDNGLYNAYFDNLYDYYNKSYIITCNASLRYMDWYNLKPNRLIKFKDNIYRLLELREYDPNNQVMCAITMIKVI